ncbi:uncharacterized protein [Palaemon carinicauda]|uniref:uncharacterized protein n=1 Tax=Palaemon carinicauda TaxID=392227 RepID=UPI0035B57F03
MNVMVTGPSVAAPGICVSEGANTANGGNMANQVILPVTQENSASLPSSNPSTTQEFVPRNSSETVTNTLAPPVNASNAMSSTFPNQEQYTYLPINTPVNTLPAPEVPKFTGDLLEYSDFILAFDTSISSRTASSSDRLYYLLQHTNGEPKDLISSCIYMQADQGYSQARQLVQQEYGDPYKASMAYLKQLNEWKPIKPDEGKCLKRYSHYLLKCFSAMQTLTHLAVLDHAPNLQVVVQKLLSYLQNKWREKSTRHRLLENRSSCFGDIVQSVINAAESVNDPVFGREAMHRELNSSKPSKGTPIESAFAMQVNHESQSRTRGFGSPSCFYCGKNHNRDNCADFRQKSL